MKHSKLLIVLLLIGAISTAPVKESEEDEKIEITKEVYSNKFAHYTAKHEIVNILVPLNSLNFDESEDIEGLEEFDRNIVIFFVEADVIDGKRVDKGLYVLKHGKATKLLEYGRDAAASSDDSKDVYFAAKDGIYNYDAKNNKAVKYGSVSDDIISIVKENTTDVIYYLNKDHELYKVTEHGQKAVKINDVVGAKEIVLDSSNNLYFYGDDKKPYVMNANGVKKIEGLPENPKTVKLIKPPFVSEDVVVFLSDETYYLIHSNGASELSSFSIHSKAKPSAYAMEATIVQYYAYKKKIYKYNVLEILLGDELHELKKYFEDHESTLRNMSPGKKTRKPIA